MGDKFALLKQIQYHDKHPSPFPNWILDGHKPVLEPNIIRQELWFRKGDRVVKQEWVFMPDVWYWSWYRRKRFWVSTVFLSIDHSMGSGPPLLFETMVFLNGGDVFQDRCTTWEQAETMHEKTVLQVKDGTINGG